jgi:hypothetical protein
MTARRIAAGISALCPTSSGRLGPASRAWSAGNGAAATRTCAGVPPEGRYGYRHPRGSQATKPGQRRLLYWCAALADIAARAVIGMTAWVPGHRFQDEANYVA